MRHPTLGDGVVLELEGDGDELKLTVFFHRAGKRKILAVQGATHYHADYVNPGWHRSMKFVKKIGRHIFYNDPTITYNES